MSSKGSALTGWHKFGQAEWRAENGEIIGLPKEKGGWLLLNKGYQDIGIYAQFGCTGDCKPGVLLRAEKATGGMKGVLVSLAGSDVGAYQVALDAQGNETSRTKLDAGPGLRLRCPTRQTSLLPPPRVPPASARAWRIPRHVHLIQVRKVVRSDINVSQVRVRGGGTPVAAADPAGEDHAQLRPVLRVRSAANCAAAQSQQTLGPPRPPLPWRIPLGSFDELDALGVPTTGTPEPRGGPIATAGGVLFIGASIDARFRAIEAKALL